MSYLRVVRWFERDGDKLIGEQPLDGVDLSILQKAFAVAADDPMYDCYPIETKQQVEYIQGVTHLVINIQSYDYFLECDAS
jgi:hypothetical protein